MAGLLPGSLAAACPSTSNQHSCPIVGLNGGTVSSVFRTPAADKFAREPQPLAVKPVIDTNRADRSRLSRGGHPTEQTLDIVCTIRVNDWFDSKWLGFSGKLVGAVGVWNTELTVPPFNPNRIREERWFDVGRDAAASEPGRRPAIHRTMRSDSSTTRQIATVAPHVLCGWYTANSAEIGRGAFDGLRAGCRGLLGLVRRSEEG